MISIIVTFQELLKDFEDVKKDNYMDSKNAGSQTQGEHAERSGFAPLSEITGNASSTKQLDHRGSFMDSKNIGSPTREKREALKGFSKREVADEKFMAKNTG